MGMPQDWHAEPAIPLTCFVSPEVAFNSRALNGWFSYVKYHDDIGFFCVHAYGVCEWLFTVMLMTMAVLASATSLCVAFIFFRRRFKRVLRGNHVDDARKLREVPSITAVIPCYLPNEQYIIEETVEWIMHKVEYSGQLNVIVVYNTPIELPEIQQRFLEMQEMSWPGGRSFRAVHVTESRSKAANLNAALKLTEDPYVVIYDADHHPDPDSLILLWEKMSRRGVDCVQGSYYMRNLSQNQFGCRPCSFPFLARIIDAEFFTDWFLMKLVTRTFFLGNGYFSGSNALWKTDVLAAREFSVVAQTEDVDMAIQQLLDGRRIEFCAESRSGELAPIDCRGMWKQRLRWTIGWDETSLKHSGAFTDSGSLNCRARCGLVWTFLVRWAMTVLTVGAVYIGLPLTTYWPLRDAIWGKTITYMGRLCFVAGAGPWFLATVESLLQAPRRGCQGFIQAFFVFLVASPFGFASFFLFNFFLQLTSCFKLSTGRVGAWEVTKRAAPTKTMKHDVDHATCATDVVADEIEGVSAERNLKIVIPMPEDMQDGAGFSPNQITPSTAESSESLSDHRVCGQALPV
mmetsp:Transcript_808/g.2085  ORF Transcript_808/g.2085 Transcript_808/m.2085 type:complete len:572 (+) Transcript_808:66-1781(+)